MEMRDAVLRLDGPAGEVVPHGTVDRRTAGDQLGLHTPGGALLALVDVGRGTDAGDYEGRPVAGAVVSPVARSAVCGIWRSGRTARPG
ncbi:MAG: hypothetical protein R2712_30855 [Vicinamibacterales bacterium]